LRNDNNLFAAPCFLLFLYPYVFDGCKLGALGLQNREAGRQTCSRWKCVSCRLSSA